MAVFSTVMSGSHDSPEQSKQSKLGARLRSVVCDAVGDMWALARQEDKAPYVAISQQDKQRYHAELEAYNYRWVYPS